MGDAPIAKRTQAKTLTGPSRCVDCSIRERKFRIYEHSRYRPVLLKAYLGSAA